MKKTLLMLLLGTALSTTVLASTWELIQCDQHERVAFLNTDSVIKNGDVQEFWLAEIDTDKNSVKGVRGILYYVQVDCKTFLPVNLEYAVHYAGGTVHPVKYATRLKAWRETGWGSAIHKICFSKEPRESHSFANVDEMYSFSRKNKKRLNCPVMGAKTKPF